MAAAGATARTNEAEASERQAGGGAEIDALMRRFFQQDLGDVGRGQDSVKQDAVKPDAVKDEVVAPPPPRRDFDMATELLDRAAQAFDLIIGRCQDLERDLTETNERARSQATEQDETIEQWKRLAAGLKAQLESSEQAMVSLRARCDAVEARAVKAEGRARALETASAQAAGQAAVAEQLSTKLHDKVVAAFGIGSRAHPVLEAVATKVVA